MLNIVSIICEQSTLHIPLVCGAYISFSLLKIPDLSIETAYTVGAMASALFLHHTNSSSYLALLLVIVISSLSAAFVGFISSILTKKMHFSHLLSCIITFGIFNGINQLCAPVYLSLSQNTNLLSLYTISSHYPEIASLLIINGIIVLLLWIFFKTQLGISYAVYGDNPLFFDNYRISSSFIFISGVMIANALAGISGYLFMQSNNFFELNMGLGKILLCITAIILGKICIKTERPLHLLVPVVGTVIYFAIQQILIKVGFNLKYFASIQAILIILISIYGIKKNKNNEKHSLLGL